MTSEPRSSCTQEPRLPQGHDTPEWRSRASHHCTRSSPSSPHRFPRSCSVKYHLSKACLRSEQQAFENRCCFCIILHTSNIITCNYYEEIKAKMELYCWVSFVHQSRSKSSRVGCTTAELTTSSVSISVSHPFNQSTCTHFTYCFDQFHLLLKVSCVAAYQASAKR